MIPADLFGRLADALDALDGWALSDVSDADERAREARGRVLLTVDAIAAAAEMARDVEWTAATIDAGADHVVWRVLGLTSEEIARLRGAPRSDVAAAIRAARGQS